MARKYDYQYDYRNNYAQWKNRLRKKARDRAKARGIECTLSVKDFEIPEVCPVLGLKLLPGMEGGIDCCATLDRLDNSKGYTAGNVRVISYRANRLKSEATLEELEALVDYMRGCPRF
jgi:hypothetical protein